MARLGEMKVILAEKDKEMEEEVIASDSAKELEKASEGADGRNGVGEEEDGRMIGCA